jgi:propanediol utilization protein
MTPPEIQLIEVKSGNWGFPDIFKLRGWMDYLNINKGVFIAKREMHIPVKVAG